MIFLKISSVPHFSKRTSAKTRVVNCIETQKNVNVVDCFETEGVHSKEHIHKERRSWPYAIVWEQTLHLG